jgi:selenide, water dikinase
MEQIKLTQFSPGAGCGCKISSKDLEDIIKPGDQLNMNSNLLVGYQFKDDAAVYNIGKGKAIVSTIDFFTPIVDNPFDFGRIAAVNAISDIYAMGGQPFLALSILGWPLDKLSKEMAGQVIDGARMACKEAGCELAGGHSINISDPVFGLAVTGMIDIADIKQNVNAKKDCRLFLTKPLGLGLITTAEKQGIVKPQHMKQAIELMVTLNKSGMDFGKLKQVKAMTDVTGFGLLGHLLEICEASKLSAHIEFNKIPVIQGVDEYVLKKAIPGGTFRNWKSYGHKVVLSDENQKMILCDPQTSGGLLIAVSEEGIVEFLKLAEKLQVFITEIGNLTEQQQGKSLIIVG